MKIYLDTADIQVVRALSKTGLIDGITTNPSHLARCGESPGLRVRDLCTLLPNGLISVEVTEKDPEALYIQAKKIAALAPNILVKIPCHADYYAVIHRLVSEGVRLNITLVFSVMQALCMAQLKVHTISPFIGRLEDAGFEGVAVLSQICAMRDYYNFDMQVLAASIRNGHHVEEAIKAGVDAMTLSPELFKSLIQHDLTDQGIAKFNADWRTLGSDVIFP